MSLDEETLDNVKVEHFEGMEGLAGDDEQLQALLEKLMEGTKQASKQGQFIQIHWIVYLIAFVTIFSVVGLFSYKLVQSLKEKERKREEKRKLKEMKKKK